MTLEEYTNKIRELVTATDDKETRAQDIIAAITADDAKRTETAGKLEEQEKRIKTLTETNSRLFLSVTGGNKTQDGGAPEEENPAETFTKLFNERYYKGEE